MARDCGKALDLKGFAQSFGEALDAKGFARAFWAALDLGGAGKSFAAGFRDGVAFLGTQIHHASAVVRTGRRRDRVRLRCVFTVYKKILWIRARAAALLEQRRRGAG